MICMSPGIIYTFCAESVESVGAIWDLLSDFNKDPWVNPVGEAD